MNIENIRHLLDRVSAISKQYEKIADITGENFNVFNILGVSHYEVTTHTAFLAELLNPKGSHGQKEVFLELFCQELKINGFDSKDAQVKKEHPIGVISKDYTTGGNLDIIITDKNGNAIVIENKIYAGDQEKQLLRYYNYCEQSHTNHHLFYLTLDGCDASEKSRCHLKSNTHYRLISYDNNILPWLEKCKEKAVNHPILRETITQYVYLIKRLTHQTLSNDMLNELISLIASNKEYYNSIDALYDAREKFNHHVIAKFWQALHEKVKCNFQGVVLEDLILESSEPSCSFPIVTFEDLEIKCVIEEDTEAFSCDFFVVGNSPEYLSKLKEYAEELGKENNDFTPTNTPLGIGWVGIKDKHLFFPPIDKNLIFDLNGEKFLDDYINDNIINELKKYEEQFKDKLKTIKASSTLNTL